MRLLNLIFPERRTSAVVARERLKIVLAHERASREAPDFLPVLQKELLDVIGRYVEIDGAGVKPTKNGVAGDGKAAAATRIESGAAAPWVKPS